MLGHITESGKDLCALATITPTHSDCTTPGSTDDVLECYETNVMGSTLVLPSHNSKKNV